MKYFVRLGGHEHEVVIDGETVTVDGQSVRGHLEEVAGTPLRLVTLGDQVHRVVARRGEERGQFVLSLEGYRFEVEALDERARTIRDLSGKSTRHAGAAHLVAPMPGLIVRVNVQEGDTVRAGQGLIVMEAMKMENELRAAANGVVKRVAVPAGSAVEKGTLLLEMEAS
jgi:biotin carboxyl carrier protein